MSLYEMLKDPFWLITGWNQTGGVHTVQHGYLPAALDYAVHHQRTNEVKSGTTYSPMEIRRFLKRWDEQRRGTRVHMWLTPSRQPEPSSEAA